MHTGWLGVASADFTELRKVDENELKNRYRKTASVSAQRFPIFLVG
jgi:hypothetical protein